MIALHSLPSSIKHGALILQTSKDGVKWLDDCVLTNVFEDTPNQDAPFYTAKDIQIINGCYYRVIVAYKTAKTVGQNQVLFVKTDDVEYQSNLEVYRFYLHGASISEVKETETKRLGTLVRAEKENNGYSGSKDIVKKDPHYSWELGHFFVSGWTRETKDDLGTPVFLKTVGDQIVLWFDLEQDIDQLNGNDALSIADDNKGYDQYFQTQPTDMGRGTLIIRYTDEKGIKHTPEIYTNYLEANATTSANTIVKLFEEGDYEVALDYRIKNAPRRVAGVDVVPTYSDYRFSFSFSVRNGNCMVFPFDVSTGAELTDESITPNGFKLDMAKSKYLDIDVTYARVMPGAHGYVEDVRINRPSKDGDSYTDEGIYTFSVKNRYTGESTTKRIYVGDADYLLALSRNGFSVAELNDYIAKGYLLEANGTLVNPTPAPTSADMTMPVPTVSVSPASKMMTEGETTAMTSTQPQAAKSFGQQGIIIIVAASAGVIVTCAVFFAVSRKKKKSNVK